MHTKRPAVLLALPALLLACEKPHATPAAADGGRPGTSESTGGPRVTAAGSVIDGSAIDGVPEMVEGMRGDFRQCYVSALEKDPKTSGSVRVTVDVGSSGAIGALSTAATKGIGKELASCLDSRVRKGKFGAPKGPRSTVMITVDVSP